MAENEIIIQKDPQMQMFSQLMEGTLKKLERYCLAARPMLGGEVYLTGEEVCKLLRLSTRTLQDYRDNGTIAYCKIGGKILYKQSDIQDMLERHYYPIPKTMATIKERKARLEQAIKDMGNIGVKVRKPEELPDFDQPIDMEEESAPAEEELLGKQLHSTSSLPKTELSSAKEWVNATEKFPRRAGKVKDREHLSDFQRKYLQPLRVSHRKAVYVSKETQRWAMWCGRLVSREQAFRGMWSRCSVNTLTATKMMWRHGENSELLRSKDTSLCRVTMFTECSKTAGLIHIILYTGKVCLCTTNCHLYHKNPCPKGD